MKLRVAVVVSHPIQHFAPWHREVAKLTDVDLCVFFCCDWGNETYFDSDFQSELKWDVPLLDGYQYEFLPILRRPQRLNYWQVDNPQVGSALARFNPDVVKVFGYTYKTNWRVAQWAHQRRKPFLLYSDSNGRVRTPPWKRLAKQAIVGHFYSKVDGALFVGDNNFEYHRRYGLPQERLFAGTLPIDQVRLLDSVPDRVTARRQVREKHGIPQDAFVVMLCGKYTANKRPNDLVAAAFSAAQKGMPVWTILVGEGPFRKEIEAFCSNHGINNAVLTCFVNQSLIANYYAAADALAVTSLVDNHPLVVSEAGTFGLPVIVSDRIGCVGADDTAQPGVNALIYPCGDRVKLAETIADLYSDPARYREMSAASLQISATQDVTVAAKQLVAAVQSLHEMGPR